MTGGAEWIAVQHTFYGGYAVVGGIAESLGFLTASALTVLLLSQRAVAAAVLGAVALFSLMAPLLARAYPSRIKPRVR